MSLIAFAEREAEAIRNDLETDPRLGLRGIHHPTSNEGPEWQVATNGR